VPSHKRDGANGLHTGESYSETTSTHARRAATLLARTGRRTTLFSRYTHRDLLHAEYNGDDEAAVAVHILNHVLELCE
jgi:hypothetical protein